MKAIRVNEHGGPEALAYEDVELPEPGPGQARVRNAASGVNFIDVYMRGGVYPGDPPFILGLEGAGEVEAVGEGVDVVYDSVGKDTFDRSLDCLKTRGYMVLFGGSSGQVPPIDLQILNQKGSLFVTRPKLADHTATRDELLWRAESLFTWIGQNNLDVRIGGTYKLSEADAAHRDLEGRKTTGKLILIP